MDYHSALGSVPSNKAYQLSIQAIFIQGSCPGCFAIGSLVHCTGLDKCITICLRFRSVRMLDEAALRTRYTYNVQKSCILEKTITELNVTQQQFVCQCDIKYPLLKIGV